MTVCICAGLNDNSIVLGKHSGRHAFRSRLEELGTESDMYVCVCMYVCTINVCTINSFLQAFKVYVLYVL